MGLQSIQRAAGVPVWAALILFHWVHAVFISPFAQWVVDNIMTTAEESTKAAIRETFSFFGRVINGMALVFVALFIDRGFYGKKKTSPRRKRRSEAWSSFWAQNGTNSTLNAVIEQRGMIKSASMPEQALYQSRDPSSWWWDLDVLRGRRKGPEKHGMRRSGSDLFERPYGFGVSERMERRGLLESVKVWLELGVEIVFAALRGLIQFVLIGKVDAKNVSSRRFGIAGQWEDLNVWTPSDVILQSGYPLEEHVVQTRDGYVLTMQRIPRKNSKEVVFFQHGVLDTSLGWVCNGPQGSQAFAAYDAGADVWLGNCRANPPRAHVQPGKTAASYWAYSINELAMEDITALISRIDSVKRSELTASRRRTQYANHGRSNSNPELFSAENTETSVPTSLEGKVDFRRLSSSKDREKPKKNIITTTPTRATKGSSSSYYERTMPLQNDSSQPYRLKVVAHSLGAASVLMYAVMCGILGQPHRISKMVLLTPAGFHKNYPTIALPFYHVLPIIMRFLNAYRPGVGAPAYIPSSLLRYITFKLSTDLHQIPALNELTRAALRLLFNGDSSEWDRALQMPHYAVASMPALSVHTGAHLIQLIRTGEFEMYDYGSKSVNMKKYGVPKPPNVAEHYGALQGISIDLVAGSRDGVINKADVMRHYKAMKDAGVEVSYKEFNAGHLDMCYAIREEVLEYVLSR